MEWTDDAIILSARPHGEAAAIVSLLSATHGRHAGLVPGGQTPRHKAGLQPGTHVTAHWHARLLDHLGTFTLETQTSYAARHLDSPEVLALIASAAAMADLCLPERQPMPGAFAGLLTFLSLTDPRLFGPVYVKWEMELLKAVGYGLDLSCCAATGRMDETLTHVSPKSGRAVGQSAAAPYAAKLLPLPRFLCGAPDWTDADILDGLNLMGHFLLRSVLAPLHGAPPPGVSPFPPARQRLLDYYQAQEAAALTTTPAAAKVA